MSRALRALVALPLLTGGLLVAAAGAASAAPSSLSEVTPSFAVFVVKDQAGGAYWLTTTTAVATATEGAADGATTLRTVNDTVLVPLQAAAGL